MATTKDVETGSYDWRTANKPAPEGKRGALRRIEIEIAENGFEIECRHKPPERKKDAKGNQLPCCEDYESLTSRYVFRTAKEVGQFISEQLS